MFTGLVEEVGTVRTINRDGGITRMTIEASTVLDDASHGDSIAVDGVCLTVTTTGQIAGAFDVDMMDETLNVSTLGHLTIGDGVHLERAMATNARFGGHLVSGHVDGIGTLRHRTRHDQWDTVTFSIPDQMAPYVVHKGSITVSGVSLTVTDVSSPADTDHWFSVGLIPTTLTDTKLGALAEGQLVNLEIDMIAKYLERLRAFDAITERSGAKDTA